MKRTLTRTAAACLALSALWLGACDDDDDGGVSHDNVTQAWSSFSDGNWNTASTEFQQALQGDPTHAEAYCGLAWSQAMLSENGGPDYSEAIRANFLAADTHRENYADAWAGLAHFHSAQLDTVQAIEWAEDLLTLAGNAYSFDYRAEVDGRSVRKIAAWNRYKLQDYDAALAHVQSVFGDFQPDTAAEDYLELLLSRIGDL